MDRRTFLKTAGMGSLCVAAGCSMEPEKFLYSLVQAPDDMIPGKSAWYASTCRECPAGCGIMVENRDGRAVKIEGNPVHPTNQGKLCIRGQAALQGVYNPDRIKTPLLKNGDQWEPIAFAEAQRLLQKKLADTIKKGPGRVWIMSETVGKSLESLFAMALERWNSQNLVFFEPYAYEGLKKANDMVFGIEGLPSYQLDQADFLLSFGADFLETWLSPVEYARKFKAMHAYQDGSKGVFFHVAPYQSLTAANADLWIPCRPASEGTVALGLLREALLAQKSDRLSKETGQALKETVETYTREQVLRISGMRPEHYDTLADRINRAARPLVLGPGVGACGKDALQAHIAANVLNAIVDPESGLIDFLRTHRVETADTRSDVLRCLKELEDAPESLLFLNQVNPVHALAPGSGVREVLQKGSLFVVSFSNFMDETTELADLIVPVQLSLETWDVYEGTRGVVSTIQPVMKCLTGAPGLGDILLRIALTDQTDPKTPDKGSDYRSYLFDYLSTYKAVEDERAWTRALQTGGIFDAPSPQSRVAATVEIGRFLPALRKAPDPTGTGLVLAAAPSIRFFDGRGANRPWLCEVPDPLTRVAWQSPVIMHPETAAANGWKQADRVRITSSSGALEAPVYESDGVERSALVMAAGQGHTTYGRYAGQVGANPFHILPVDVEPDSGAPLFIARNVTVQKTGVCDRLARTDGSRVQHGRKIALTIELKAMTDLRDHSKEPQTGLSMWDYPLTLPLAEGYSGDRDAYPAHDHADYRWAMAVDLDRCIGCGACAAACYAENNVAVVGSERIAEGREMAWLSIERYQDADAPHKVTFLPMLCQHCDNAPCESVCPVYAPHHSKEGLNNQIYNRCIGTRFCSQNCPYKVRRFNWFEWKWPEPLHLALNPDVTVRSKGVMEKCSFCVQRIKDAHDVAKNEKRKIRDGEVTPACVQTCPTNAFVFGNLMDANSAVRKMVADERAYQVMGYLNTKPAVIYLKKVVQEV